MRSILQLCLLLLLLGAGVPAWGRMAAGPRATARRAAEGSTFHLGGGAPPALPASGEAAMWGGEVAGAGNGRTDSMLTTAGQVVVPVRGATPMACPGSPPPSNPGATTNLPWMMVGPNVYAYVKENPWSAFDPHGLDASYANDYTKQVVTNVRAADPRLDQIMTEVEQSPHHFEFNATWSAEDTKKYGAKGMFTPQTPDGRDALPRETHDRYNGKGMGGRVNAPKENVAGKTPEQTMAHELGHVFDANRGITPLDPKKPAPNKIFPTRSVNWEENENRAVRTENIYNERKEKPVRKEYGGDPVPNPEGKNAPVNTEPKDKAPKKTTPPSSSAKDTQEKNTPK